MGQREVGEVAYLEGFDYRSSDYLALFCRTLEGCTRVWIGRYAMI